MKSGEVRVSKPECLSITYPFEMVHFDALSLLNSSVRGEGRSLNVLRPEGLMSNNAICTMASNKWNNQETIMELAK